MAFFESVLKGGEQRVSAVIMQKATGKKVRYDRVAYALILPFFVIFTYFYFIPVIKVILDSFTDYDMFTQRNYVGLENYMNLFQDEHFLKSVGNTFFYTVLTLFPALILGLLVALIVNNTSIKTKLSRMFIFMPHVVSMVATSMIWLYMYEPVNGVFNTVLQGLGFAKQQWLLNPNLAMGSMIVMGIWKGVGYYMIVFLSGLKSIPEQYYEAAKIDGSSSVNTFFRITLPLLSPTTSFLLITGIISSFNVFEQVNVMTQGGPMYSTTTMVHQIYTAGFSEYKLGYASAMSVFLLLIVVVITMVNFRLTRQDKE